MALVTYTGTDGNTYADPNASYYALDVTDPQTGDPTYFVFPTSQGHYNVSGLQVDMNAMDPYSGGFLVEPRTPGIAAQTQVAP